jgi:hypothetical protein
MAASNPSLETIYQALPSLTVVQLDDLIREVFDVRKQKIPHVLSEEETVLLHKIYTTIPTEIMIKYTVLQDKKALMPLSEQEYSDLLALTALIEEHDVNRLLALTALAKLRNQPLKTLMETLGIKPQEINVA